MVADMKIEEPVQNACNSGPTSWKNLSYLEYIRIHTILWLIWASALST
jgi:hypothetical protein